MSGISHILEHPLFPWFTIDGNVVKPRLIGIGGGSASGKSTLCKTIISSGVSVLVVSTDNFYRRLSEDELRNVDQFSFDEPSAFDWDLLVYTLGELLAGRRVDMPLYDFKTHKRLKKTTSIYGVELVILEGILALHDPRVRDLMDLRIFVDCDPDVRLVRRIRRDTKERGRSLESVLLQYEKSVKPAFDTYILPTREFADIVVPRGCANQTAPRLIVAYCQHAIEARHLIVKTSFSRDIPPANPTEFKSMLVGDMEKIVGEYLMSELELDAKHRHPELVAKARGMLFEALIEAACKMKGKDSKYAFTHVRTTGSNASEKPAPWFSIDLTPGGVATVTLPKPNNGAHCVLVFENDSGSAVKEIMMALRVCLDYGYNPDRILLCLWHASASVLAMISKIWPDLTCVILGIEGLDRSEIVKSMAV